MYHQSPIHLRLSFLFLSRTIFFFRKKRNVLVWRGGSANGGSLRSSHGPLASSWDSLLLQRQRDKGDGSQLLAELLQDDDPSQQRQVLCPVATPPGHIQ